MKLEDLTQEKLDEVLASVEAMTASNQGLKADLAKAKAKAKGADIDPEVHAGLQTQVEELTTKLDKLTRDSTKQIETLNKTLGDKDGAINKYLVESQLTDALAKAGVKPEFMDASKALLKSQATIKSENGEYKALIGDKALSDHVKEWATGEQGKHFVAAAENNGGGSQGGGNKGTGKTMTRAEHDQKSAAGDRTLQAFFREGGTLVD